MICTESVQHLHSLTIIQEIKKKIGLHSEQFDFNPTCMYTNIFR